MDRKDDREAHIRGSPFVHLVMSTLLAYIHQNITSYIRYDIPYDLTHGCILTTMTHSKHTKNDWGQLESLVLAALELGPKTTRQLKQLGIENGYTEEQVAKLYATRWMDLPRHPGKTRFDPWTVYHPASTAAKVLGISHAIDDWLVAYMTSAGRAVLSTQVAQAAREAGFTDAQLLTAYRRCQVVPFKTGKHWYRQVPPPPAHPYVGATAARRAREVERAAKA